jgi:hypothetical protein
VWSRGGSELVYRREKQFLAVDIRTEPSLAAGAPRLLFSGDFRPGAREDGPFEYDVSTDGNTVYATRTLPMPEPERQLVVVTDWLQSRAPETK